MRFRRFHYKFAIALAALWAGLGPLQGRALADPSKYPEFAQQTLPNNVPLELINIEDLVAGLKEGVKPLLIDVRTVEEYREVHILGALSAPLGEFKEYLKSIPRDRPVVLY